jgi:nucleotide-binding universal stress UspA family protein
MYRRMLIPLDGSPLAEQVLPYARAMARALQPLVHLLRVCDVGHEARGGSGPARPAEAQRYLERMAGDLVADGLAVQTMVWEGDAAGRIVEEGFREPGTLIAMATHGRSGLTRWALGSVTDKVLRATASPLLVITPSTADPITPATAMLRTIVVPLDGSDEAEGILQHVVALRASMRLPAVLVRVVSKAGADEADASRSLERARERLVRPDQPPVEVRVLRGNPATTIIHLARGMPGALVAMTTHGRTGVSRWALGGVADRVVRTAGVPVLVVQPGAEWRWPPWAIRR